MIKFKTIFLFFLVLALFSKAAIANEMHIFIPGLQFRYENGQGQDTDYQRYNNYNLAAVVFSDYMVGLEFNELKNRSQNGSVTINSEFQEFNIYGGYYFYSQILNYDFKVILDLGPTVYIGQNRTTVETNVSETSIQSIGENNLVWGAGLQATLRVNYFIFQPEVRVAYSRNYQPSPVYIYGLRAGFRLGF